MTIGKEILITTACFVSILVAMTTGMMMDIGVFVRPTSLSENLVMFWYSLSVLGFGIAFGSTFNTDKWV